MLAAFFPPQMIIKIASAVCVELVSGVSFFGVNLLYSSPSNISYSTKFVMEWAYSSRYLETIILTQNETEFVPEIYGIH